MGQVRVGRLLVVGVGLIGGSFALALKAAGACREVIGVALQEEVCEQAKRLGVVDRAYTSLPQAANSWKLGIWFYCGANSRGGVSICAAEGLFA